MFMIGSKILRLMMSSFYVRVAKALVRLHAYLVLIFRLLKKKMAVGIIPAVIATLKRFYCIMYRLSVKPGPDLGTNYLQNGKWYQQTTMYTLMRLFLRY